MHKAQPEYDVEIQAFRRWFSSSQTRRSGVGGSSHATRCEFIPFSACKKYLGAHRRVENLLISLFGEEAARNIDAQYIREHNLRSLAILLVISEGPMIKHFVRYTSLQDHRLPHRTRPDDFPFSPDPKFFERFRDQQWQFCATTLRYRLDHDLHKEEILPITHKEEIGSGGNAVIFKIVVDEEYNELVPPGRKGFVPVRPEHQNTFVLKTYRGPDAKQQHEAEKAAFAKLRSDTNPSPYVIAYHGSFVDEGTENIILEYADQGSFEEFMMRTPKPSTSRDMLEFWDRFSYITHGLASIHGTERSTLTGIPMLLGWHQDIKPANILVFSGSGISKYDYFFKIADLSLCHFKQSESLHDEDPDFDAFGTRAYGAPETFRLDDSIYPILLEVGQHVDIWSMGCVFSEAAVWSRFGWNRVLEYRQRRQQQVKDLTGRDGEHLFHDGTYVLPIVQEMHEVIAKKARQIDLVTLKILHLLSSDMLINKNKLRSSAHDIFLKIRHARQIVLKELEAPTIEISSLGNVEGNRVMSDLEERAKTPPNIPPGYINNFGASDQTPVSMRVGVFSPATPMLMDSGRATNGNRRDQQNDNTAGSLCSDSVSLHDLPDPPSPTTSYQPSSIDRFNALSINTHDKDHAQGLRRPHRESTGNNHHRARGIPPSKALLHRSHTEQEPSKSSFSESLWPNSDSGPLTHPPSSSSNPCHSKSSLEAVSQIISEPEEQEHQHEPKPPHLSLDEGLLWKAGRKKDHLNGQENFAYLNERDHIFVIDNTNSMRAHREDVLNLLSLLTYMLKDSDPNGLDVCFTQSKEKINSGKSTKLLKAVSQVQYLGMSDMQTRLSQILQEHKEKFSTNNSHRGLLQKVTGRWEKQKSLSVYILTDGIWPPRNSVASTIVALVNSMKENKLPKDHVAIQFIRFGEDPHGIDRLNKLDHGLGLEDTDMDIVDTTPWNGNIWKQLLGAILPWYDDDPL